LDSEIATPPATGSPRTLVRRYLHHLDVTVLAFAALAAVGWLLGNLGQAAPWMFAGGNVVVVLGMTALLRAKHPPRPVRAATIGRILLVHVVVPFNFFQCGPLIRHVRLGAVPGIERTLLAWDTDLLGGSYHDWIIQLRVPWVTEILQIVYASFYILPLALALLLIARGKAWSLPAALFGMATAFLVSYVGYALVPAQSPAYLDAALAPDDGVWIAGAIWDQIREAGRGCYDVFPSGHTAMSVLAIYYAWRFDRIVASIVTPVALGVVISTIYLQYHYIVDIPAGLALTLLIVLWDQALQRRAPTAPTLQASWSASA